MGALRCLIEFYGHYTLHPLQSAAAYVIPSMNCIFYIKSITDDMRLPIALGENLYPDHEKTQFLL